MQNSDSTGQLDNRPKKAFSITAWLGENALWLVLLTTLLGFALGELYRHIYALLAILGVYYAVRYRKPLAADERIRLLLILFAGIWLPMVIATVDAESFERSLRTSLRFCAYLFAAVSIIHLAGRQRFEQRLLFGSFILMLLISLDGLLQWATGSDLLGYPAYADKRIVGIFYPRPYMSLFLAIFSPLYYEAVRRLSARYRFAWLSLIPLFAAIVLGASRTAWMLNIIATAGYAYFYIRTQSARPWRKIVLRAAGISVVAVLILLQSDWLEQRMVVVGDLFSGNATLANQATSQRLPLWQSAFDIAQKYWVNGIGPRGFDAYYESHIPKNDPWFKQNGAQPHLLLLEVAAETGVIGLLGYLLFYLTLIVKLFSALSRNHLQAIPWGLSALVAAFPLSSAMPLYGFYYAQLVWLPLTLFLALLGDRSQASEPLESAAGE